MENQLQTTQQQGLALNQPSQKLMQCLQKSDNKLELAVLTSDLMPKGLPDFAQLIQCKPIAKIMQEIGKQDTAKYVLMLLQNFCSSQNVVRNMEEDQMIECAVMMVDECDGFTLEDYQVMFEMAKRGSLDFNSKKGLMDRIDSQTISKIMDAYYTKWRMGKERLRNEREEELYRERQKNREERLKSGEVKVIELPPDYFAKELKKLQDAADENRQKEFQAYIGRREQRKEEFIQKMAETYGYSVEDMKKYVSEENQKSFEFKQVGSKINE